MRYLLLLMLSLNAHADTKISALPLGNAATTSINDSFPYVDSIALETKRLKLSDLINLPSLSAPTFPGTVTSPLFVGPLTGTASLATALAATPSFCSGGQFALGVDVHGNAICGTPSAAGGSGIDTQEAPSGLVNSVNETYILSKTPSTSIGVSLFVDGGILKQCAITGCDYSVSGSTITTTFAPVPGQVLWATYASTSSSNPVWNIEELTLSPTNITNQFVNLAFTALTASIDVSVQGLEQVQGVDYSVSVIGGVTRITFIGNLATGGSTPLIAGNLLNVQYQH